MKTIAVFGSGAIKRGTPAYQTAYDVGAALARAGYIVMTGGYMGVMAAVSEGAVAAHTENSTPAADRVIGVTYGPHSRTQDGVNEWVQQEIRYDIHEERLQHLVREPDGYVVMPGGMGTQREFERVAQYVENGTISVRPMVFVGNHWKQDMTALLLKVNAPGLREHCIFVDGANAVVSALTAKLG
ncbi:MAG: LOG family protein [Chloroflexota bacterium]